MSEAEVHVARLLRALGEDITRDGLRETPHRYAKAMAELTSGMREDPATILKTFPLEGDGGIVCVRSIPFSSLCEHHLLPFVGEASVAYIPGRSIVGLSKIPRLVHCYARRLQVQERLACQVADAMERYLKPKGVAVVIRGEHSCMRMRGVRSTGDMVTSEMRGVFRGDPSARAEVMGVMV